MFKEWPKIPRSGNVRWYITEKIDGTNAAIIVNEDGSVQAQSRTRIITPDDDNFGFAKWVYQHAELFKEKWQPGHYYGEWWGAGIQRGYDQTEKIFSLFGMGTIPIDGLPVRHTPLLASGKGLGYAFIVLNQFMDSLREGGSVAAPGYKKPEGLILTFEGEFRLKYLLD